TAKEFNKLSAEDRWAKLDQAMRGFDPSIRAFAHTWDAISSTTKDLATNWLRLATAPLFTRVRDQLESINDWVGANQAKVDDWAAVVGNRLVFAFDKVKGLVVEIHDHWREMLHTAGQLGTGALAARGALALAANPIVGRTVARGASAAAEAVGG